LLKGKKVKINSSVLREAIFIQNLKQWEIAQCIGIPESRFSQIVRGRKEPTEGIVEKIARALHIDKALLSKGVSNGI